MPLTERQIQYHQYLASNTWKAKRQQAFAHYGPQCNRCPRPGEQVHHKTYARVGGKELMEDLEVLCATCHQRHHEREKAARFGYKIKNRPGIRIGKLYKRLKQRDRSFLMGKYQIQDEETLYRKICLERSPALVQDALDCVRCSHVIGTGAPTVLPKKMVKRLVRAKEQALRAEAQTVNGPTKSQRKQERRKQKRLWFKEHSKVHLHPPSTGKPPWCST